MSKTQESAQAAPYKPTDRAEGTAIDVSDVHQEAATLATAYWKLLQSHGEVEHLAGLSAHAIAQELIDHFGPERVLAAIAAVRRAEKDYFFDVILQLLPGRRARLAFYRQLRSGNAPAEPVPASEQQQQPETNPAVTASDTATDRRTRDIKRLGQILWKQLRSRNKKRATGPRASQATSPAESTQSAVLPEQQDAYLHLCEQFDAPWYRTLTMSIPPLRNLVMESTHRQLQRQKDGNLVAHHHFSALPKDFDPRKHLPALAESDNNLAQLQQTENERFRQEIRRISLECDAIRARIQVITTAISSDAEANWAAPIAAMQSDIAHAETTVQTLQTEAAKKIVQAAIFGMRCALTDIKNARDRIIRERRAPYDAILRVLPHISETHTSTRAGEAAINGRGHQETPRRNGHRTDNGHQAPMPQAT